MSASKLELGDIITALFPVHNPQSREQQGYRPAVVVGLPNTVGTPRYDMVIVVPLTTDHNQIWANAAPYLYPRLKAGIGNLPHDSIALTEQVRSLHTSRMMRYVGQLSKHELKPIRRALAKMGS
jgi:mRNA interferase MazF